MKTGKTENKRMAGVWTGGLSAFCLLLTAAHFLRAGDPAAVVLCLLMAVCSFFHTGWLVRSVTVLLAGGTLFWGVETVQLAQARMVAGLPFLHLLLVLSGVVLAHAAAVFLMRKRWQPVNGAQKARSTVFTMSLFLLLALNTFVPFPLLAGERLIPLPGINGLLIAALAWWGGFCAQGLSDPRTSPSRRRLMWTVFASVFFLQFFLGVTVAVSLLMTGRLHLPVPFMMLSGPVYRGEGIFMICLFCVSVLIAGSAWCSHLCYFGIWDCLSASSSQRRLRPAPVGSGARDWRLPVLAAAVAVPLILNVLQASYSVVVGAALAFMALAPLMWYMSSRSGGRVYCSSFCPMGLVAGLLGKLSPWRLSVDKDRCTGCMKCAAACQDRAMILREGKCEISYRCTLCRDCLMFCSHGALSLDCTLPVRGRRRISADPACIITISLMHILFLATARI